MEVRHELGRNGENLAAAYLEKEGYIILARNYRYLKSEIDLIARTKDIIIGVEVKTRSSRDFGNPQEFVKPKQINNLVLALDHFVQNFTTPVEVRFDIIAIVQSEKSNEIEHIKDAFYHF